MILCQYQIWPSVVIHPVIWWVMTRWSKAAKTKLISNFLSTFLLRQLQNYVFALDKYQQKTCSICKSDCMLLTEGSGTMAKLFLQQGKNQSRGSRCTTTQLLGTCWDFLIFGDSFFCCNAQRSEPKKELNADNQLFVCWLAQCLTHLQYGSGFSNLCKTTCAWGNERITPIFGQAQDSLIFDL